jgi:hypothetical protein
MNTTYHTVARAGQLLKQNADFKYIFQIQGEEPRWLMLQKETIPAKDVEFFCRNVALCIISASQHVA